MPWDR